LLYIYIYIYIYIYASKYVKSHLTDEVNLKK
jgi:hypothetical protein